MSSASPVLIAHLKSTYARPDCPLQWTSTVVLLLCACATYGSINLRMEGVHTCLVASVAFSSTSRKRAGLLIHLALPVKKTSSAIVLDCDCSIAGDIELLRLLT